MKNKTRSFDLKQLVMRFIRHSTAYVSINLKNTNIEMMNQKRNLLQIPDWFCSRTGRRRDRSGSDPGSIPPSGPTSSWGERLGNGSAV